MTKRIVFGVSGAMGSTLARDVLATDVYKRQVAEYAALLASKLGAEVTAIYVAPTLSQYTGFKVPQSDIHAFVGEIVSGAQASMNAFVAEHFEGVKATGEVLVGYASDEILAKAKRDDMDLIVTVSYTHLALYR